MDRAYQKQITEARMYLNRASHTLNFRSALIQPKGRRKVRFILRDLELLLARLSDLRKVV
jgi:hypothetical protein